MYYSSWRTPALLPRAIFTQHARHINREPQSPAAPNSKPPSIWITDYIPLSLPFLPLAAPLSCPSTPPLLHSLHSLPVTPPLSPLWAFFFSRHFTTPCPRPSSVSCPSIIHISSPEHLGSTRCASLQSAVIACWAGVTAWLTCPRAQISSCLRAADALFAESSCNAGPTFQNYLQTACEISPVGGVFTRAWRGCPAPLWV